MNAMVTVSFLILPGNDAADELMLSIQKWQDKENAQQIRQTGAEHTITLDSTRKPAGLL